MRINILILIKITTTGTLIRIIVNSMIVFDGNNTKLLIQDTFKN